MNLILIIALSFAALGTVIFLGMLWKSEKTEEKPSKEKTRQLTDLFTTTETDLISIPHIGIGRYLKVSEKDDKEGYKLVVEGLLVSSALITSKDEGKESLAVRMMFLNKEGKTVSYKIPITQQGQPKTHIETKYIGAAVPKSNMFIKDLAEFCNNQCILDCENCKMKKYGLRKITR